MPYYRFVIHLLFYITMALSTDLILFEDIFYFPHFMKIFLVFFLSVFILLLSFGFFFIAFYLLSLDVFSKKLFLSFFFYY